MRATRRPRSRRLAAVAAFAAAAAGCASNGGARDAGADAGFTIFPADFRAAGFQMVRACRAPGEHSGLDGFTVWVDDAAATTYDQLLGGSGAGDAGARQMPAGAIVVKELYGDRGCTTVDRWVAMKKIAGFDPAHGDWYWQDVAPTRAVVREGQVPACSDCHEGRADATCVGYGAVNGMDYLCTAP